MHSLLLSRVDWDRDDVAGLRVVTYLVVKLVHAVTRIVVRIYLFGEIKGAFGRYNFLLILGRVEVCLGARNGAGGKLAKAGIQGTYCRNEQG